MNRWIVVMAAALPTFGANAQQAYAPSDVELRGLPAYCQAKFGAAKGDQAQLARWNAHFGPDNWVHMHHYCLGANFVQRLHATTDRQKRTDLMKEAVANYVYVLEHGEKSFWMRPQIQVEAGKILAQMGQRGEAARYYSQALAANPDYQPAYLPLIQAYRDAGSSASALEVATTGLRHFPESKPLQEAYLSLGGKKPFPEPISRGVAASKPEAATFTPSPAESRSEEASRQSGETLPEGGQGAAGDSAVPPERGCRFCPPEEIQQKWRESFGEAQKK